MLFLFTAILAGSGWLMFFTPDRYEFRGVAEMVTAQSLRSIELGSSEGDVVSALGEPIAIEEHPEVGFRYLYYSSPVSYAFWQPHVWVILREGVVTNIWARRMAFWGDEFDRDYYNKNQFGVRESNDFEESFGRQ